MDLITDHLDVWTTAQAQKATGRGKSANNQSIYGIKKLRELILELAVRGKLVPQNPDDEPASKLLQRIAKEKEQLLKAGKIKKQKLLPQTSGDEEPFELPIAWKWENLSGIVAVVTDGDHQAPPKSDTGVPFLVIGNLNSGNVVLDGCRFVPNTYYEKLDWARRPTKGDILYTVTGSYGIPIQVHRIEHFCVQRHVAILKATSITPSRYLSLVLASNHAFKFSTDVATGIAQKTIPLTKLREMPIPVPPLAEQHRIVAKVDELMTLCDQLEQQQTNSNATHQTLVETLLATLTRPTTGADGSETNAIEIFFQHFDTLFTTEQSIDQLKQTILQLAVMGKLVPQDPDEKPASTLLLRIAKEKDQLIKSGEIKKQKPHSEISDAEKPFKIPKGWEWVRIWNIANLITSGSRGWAKHYANNGAIFVTMGNLSQDGYKLRMDSIRYVNPPKSSEGARTRLREHDLLISITGDVGNLGLIPKEFGEAYINQHTCLLRFMPDCQNRYWPEFMRSPLATWQFNAPQRGVKNSFRLGDVGEIIAPMPPLAEQHRIVAKVDELMTLCEDLKVRHNETRATQAKLADTIVDKAVT